VREPPKLNLGWESSDVSNWVKGLFPHVWDHVNVVAEKLWDPVDFYYFDGPQPLPWVLLKKEKSNFALPKTLGDLDTRDLWDVRSKG
jgi:hypothetical protein